MSVFLTTKQTAQLLGVSEDTLKMWRLGQNRKSRGYRVEPRLIQGAHWTRYSSRKVLFNRDLMLDFVANQHAPEVHQKAVMAYLASLPSSKAVM